MKPSSFQILISPLNLKLTRDPETFLLREVVDWLQDCIVLRTFSENSDGSRGSVSHSLAQHIIVETRSTDWWGA